MDARPLVARLQALGAAFTRSSLDVPDGTIDRGCTFRLSGIACAEAIEVGVRVPQALVDAIAEARRQ